MIYGIIDYNVIHEEKNFDQKQIHPADKSKQSYAITDAFFLKSGSILSSSEKFFSE